MTRASLKVPDIECEACAGAIRRALGQSAGIGSVNVDVLEKRVEIEFDPAEASLGSIRAALEQAGFQAE